MFVVDYKQQLADHGKIVILVKNFEPKCPNILFEQAFQSISKHHPLVHARHAVSRSATRRVAADSLISLPTEFQYEPSESPSICMRPIWVRYVREFHSVNQAWATFQAHRAVVGLIGLCCCTTEDEIEEVIRVYMEQKALISENPVNGRLFVLIPSSDPHHCHLSIEHATLFIQEEQKRMPQNLLLTSDEILAHPLEQFFNLEFQHAELNGTHSTNLQAKANNPGSEPTDKLFTCCDTVCKAAPVPILNPRLAGALVDLTSHICHDLDRVLLTADPKSTKFLISPTTSATLDPSDGDSSDSTFSGLTGTGSSKSAKPSDKSLRSDDHHFISRPYITSSFNTGSNPNLAASTNDAGAIKQRRNSGRWKKHLADLSLQLGEYDLAHLYYEASLQLLRPLMDNLWIAGALEGLSAIAVLRNDAQKQHPEGYSPIERSMLHGVRASAAASTGKNDEFQGQKTLNSTSAVILTPREHYTTALDALDIYRKLNVEAGFLEETTFKMIRLLIAVQQSSKACELIDYMLRITFEEEKDEVMNVVKRLSTIAGLYHDLGYRRRAGFVTWLAFVRNLKLPDEENHSALFTGLYIHFVSPSVFCVVPWFPHDGSHPAEQEGRQLFLRSPAVPTSLFPVNTLQKSLRFCVPSNRLGIGTFIQNLSKPNRFSRRWSTKSHNILTERITFRPTGWASLQASTIWLIIERLKADLRFDDNTDIPWEMALRLTGFIFSLLDFWPDYLDESKTETCLDDLRRLAVLRSPDQPHLLDPSVSFFTPDVSGNAASRRHRNKAATGQVNDPRQRKSSDTLRQLVDLLEIPTHRLPSIQTINLLPLPKFLLPCELSKDALASVVHCPISPMDEAIRSDLTQSTDSAVVTANSDRPPGLFYYAPIDIDEKGREHFRVVDWVCEEPVAIELLVDNALPVVLRLSDLRIELSQVFTGPVACSPTASTCTNNIPSSPGRPIPTCFHLDAVRVVVEKSVTGTRTSRHSTPTFTTAYGVELNQACLLESAHFKYIHPHMKLDAVWQRRSNHLSCTIPAKTFGNRLVIHVIPPTNMLLSLNNHLDEQESGLRIFYRISGITYRLVDCGAIHACVRVPTEMLHLDPLTKPVHESISTPMHERHLSSSSSSVLSTCSVLRSSVTCESDSVLNCTPASDSLPQHSTLPFIQSLFVDLPAIRLRAAMPRMFIFPGIARSAQNLKEAADFLPQLTVPLVRPNGTALSATSSNDIPAPRFHLPISEHWSEQVATMFHISVYPYESRWLPLRVFVRDESQAAFSSLQSRQDMLITPRHLNALHICIKPTDSSAKLLRMLNLIPEDLVKCHNVDSVHRKMPLPIRNERTTTAPVKYISDGICLEDESVSPVCATECGLIWFSFHSEAFWRNLSQWFIRSAHRNVQKVKDLSFRNTHTVMLEIQIEYALNVPCKESCSVSHVTSTQCVSDVHAPARCVTIGIHLSLLSSKHSPLLLYYPQLSFCDELREHTARERTQRSEKPTGVNEYESKALFSCTLQARLPASLVPRHLRLPGRQYRVRLEVSSSWAISATPSTRVEFAVVTPWTSLFEQNSHIPVSTRFSSQSISPVSTDIDGPVSPLISTATEVFHSMGDLYTSATGDFASSDHPTHHHHHLTLPLEELSRVIFGSNEVQVTSSGELLADEIGLPLPANTDVTVRLIESHIWIAWKSWLDGRVSHSIKTNSTEKLNAVLPDPRFHRFGRLCLAAHSAELPAPQQLSLLESQTKPSVSRNWYGNAFANKASTAGLLWCHNLHLKVNAPDSINWSGFREPDLATTCRTCFNDSSGRYTYLPAASRRYSQQRDSSSSNKPMSAAPHQHWRSEEADEILARDSTAQFSSRHRFSMPELRHPLQLQGLPLSVLPSFRHTCTPLLHPLPLSIESYVTYNPMDDLRLKVSDKTSDNSEIISVNVHRVWTCPVVYEIIEKAQTEADGKTKPTTELSPPLIEGKDFGYFGSAGGMAGLRLNGDTSELRNQTGSIVFYRPGHFWICGLLGLLPPTSPDLPSCSPFTPPTPSDLETIRFSADGLRVHVFDPDRT